MGEGEQGIQVMYFDITVTYWECLSGRTLGGIPLGFGIDKPSEL